MPEQIDPRPADAVPSESHRNGDAEPPGTVATGLTREQLPPFVSPTDILLVSPLHREVIAELRWAYEQCERGAFNAYLGQYLAIVNRTVEAVGDPGCARDEAANKTGVPPERVALFYVGGE
ncbi:MAG TPA: hypothetical protein VKA46_22815 [Gemmataceae bacterium]|nr:hypothetical protein [Gemmataceae bacterium]